MQDHVRPCIGARSFFIAQIIVDSGFPEDEEMNQIESLTHKVSEIETKVDGIDSKVDRIVRAIEGTPLEELRAGEEPGGLKFEQMKNTAFRKSLVAVFKWTAGIIAAIIAIVTATLLISKSASGAELEVNGLLAKPISLGGKGVYTLADLDTLGLDTAKVILFASHGPAAWNARGRGGTYNLVNSRGSNNYAGSPLGDTLFTRIYDGSNDIDSLDATKEDSVEIAPNMTFICLFKMNNLADLGFVFSKGEYGDAGYGVYIHNVSNDIFFFLDDGPGSFIYAKKSGTFDDGEWHYLVTWVTSDSMFLEIDGLELTAENRSYIDPSTVVLANCVNDDGLSFGGNIDDDDWSADYKMDGGLCLFLCYANTMTATQRDTIWNTVSDYIDATEPYLSVQTALDQVQQDSTIRIYPGRYFEPLQPKTSCRLVGTSRTGVVLDGIFLPSTNFVLYIESVHIDLDSLTVANLNGSGTAIYLNGNGSELEAENVAFIDNYRGVAVGTTLATDSSSFVNCTWDGVTTGVRSNAGCAGSILVRNSIFSGCTYACAYFGIGDFYVQYTGMYNVINALFPDPGNYDYEEIYTITSDPFDANSITSWDAKAGYVPLRKAGMGLGKYIGFMLGNPSRFTGSSGRDPYSRRAYGR